MSEFSREQTVQEQQYSYPYHYIPQYKKGFSTAVFSGYGINYVSTVEFLLSKLEQIECSSICDVGSGDGRLVQEMAGHFPDKEVEGIDYSERVINMARGLNPSLNFSRVDIVNDNLDKKYDVLTLIEVFEHIPTDKTDPFISALHGMLNEEGTLLLTVPHKNKPLSAKHYQHYNSAGLRACFKEFFRVEEEVFFEKARHWRLYFIRRLLKNKMFILNNRRILNWLYSMYKRKCFHAEEKDCGRIYLRLKMI